MTRLALASLRFRAAASVATFVAVLVGCALLIACGGLMESAIRLGAVPQRLAGAPVVVAGSEGFKLPDEESETVAYPERAGVDPSVLPKVAATSGVAKAVPDITFAATIAGDEPGTDVLFGHNWASAALTPFTVREGAEPRPGQVSLDEASADRRGAEVGAPIDLVVGGRAETFTVAGILHGERAIDAPALFFAEDDARRLSPRSDKVDAIGVVPADGVDVDDLAERLGAQLSPGASVLTGDDRGAAEYTGIGASRLPLILLAAVFGGMVLVVMALVVSATISLSVRQRQQELALLRASGATPAQAHRMVVAETMAVALLGAVCGLPAGALAGGQIFDASTAQGVFPTQLVFHQGLVPFAGGFLLALGIPWLTAHFAARAAARARPIQALSEAAIPTANLGPVRRTLGKAFAAATVALAVATMFLDPETASAVGGPAVLTGSIAAGLFGPELVHVLAGMAVPVLRRFSGGAIAVINIRARARQFAAVLTPLTLATAIALGNIYAQTTQSEAATAARADELSADVVVSSGDRVVSPDLATRLRGVPGVTAVSSLVVSKGWVEEPYDGNGSDPSTLLGVDAQTADPVLNTPVAEGSLRDLGGASVALPRSEAEDLGAGLGAKVTLRLGDGARVEVAVVALLDGSSNYPSVVVPAALLAPHTSTGLASEILVRGTGDLASGVRQVAGPGTTVGDGGVLAAEFATGVDVQAWISYLLAVLAIAYAAIAAVNTLGVAVLSRRRELALQRLAGATRRQVTRMLFVEGTVLGVLALALGTVISLFTVLPIAIATGSVLPSGPIWVFVVVVDAAFLIVWPVTAITGRLAMKRKPVDELSIGGGQ
ncbi:ABC transporter permease [Amycolatopsis minnesotensis]|uniref:FtsX-like permease family protein n=1 Tax=Amycolatopsis minnesotensis TaxID=337894 RepID=A0ABN2QF88_9PSEU